MKALSGPREANVVRNAPVHSICSPVLGWDRRWTAPQSMARPLLLIGVPRSNSSIAGLHAKAFVVGHSQSTQISDPERTGRGPDPTQDAKR